MIRWLLGAAWDGFPKAVVGILGFAMGSAVALTTVQLAAPDRPTPPMFPADAGPPPKDAA